MFYKHLLYILEPFDNTIFALRFLLLQENT